MTTPTRGAPPKLRTRNFEFRAVGDGAVGDGRTLEGYAATFNSPTEIDSWEGKFIEEIAPGAFKRTLNAKTPVLQFDHGRDQRTGTVPIGSIQAVREDDHGLYVSARLYANDVVEPIRQAIEGGSIDGMSFRFRVVRDEWTDNAGVLLKASEVPQLLWDPGERGPLRCVIREVELFELGPVVFPAYASTSVGVRSLLDGLDAADRERLVAELAATRDIPQTSAETAEPDPPPVTSPPSPAIPNPAAAPESTGAVSRMEPDRAPVTSAPTTSTPPSKETAMDGQMTVEERAVRRDEIKARMNEIAKDYAGSALPEDIQKEWNGLLREHGEQVDAIEAHHERMRQLAQIAEDEPAATERPRSRYAGVNVTPRKPDNIYDISAIRSQARSLDELPGLYRDNAMRAIEVATYVGADDADEARSNAERVLNIVDDESGTLARRFLATGSKLYERAFGKVAVSGSDRGLTGEERAALAIGADATGGYAVPFDLDPTVILTSNGSVNPLRSMARVEQTTGKKWQGITSAGITVSRAAEAAQVADGSPTIGQPEAIPTRVQGFVQFSIEIETTWPALRREITTMLGEAKDDEEASSFVNGDGTGVNPQGIVAGLAAGQQVRTNGGVVGAASFDVQDLFAVKNALPNRWRGRAQWLATSDIYDVIRTFPEPFFADNLREGTPEKLAGYPRREVSTMATAVASDAEILLIGDFRQFLIVDQIGMNIELVQHIMGANQRPTGERGIYAVWRNTSKILVPNAFRLLVINAAA